MFPKEVRWFHECHNSLRQTNGKQCYTFIYSCLPWSLDWSLWWHPPKKSKQKIMTKIKKKLSRKSSYPWKRVVCVASKHFPHQKMNSIPFPMPLLMPQELCMLFHYAYISLSIISTWKMALLWIIKTSDSKYTRMIT